DAELLLGRHAAAATAFERAERIADAIGHGVRHDARAGRARAALAQGDTAAAVAHEQQLLDLRAAGRSWDGADSRLILWTCHTVLMQAGDSRAAELLAAARVELEARAATINDATLRDSFVANVPHHRAIAAAATG
ncbi:MAG TPA: hypothetical protein PL196_09455, partial [Burkholderiaceae bacterium]|nr:hypothetical protein [Burkholderiaceae bacterium]